MTLIGIVGSMIFTIFLFSLIIRDIVKEKCHGFDIYSLDHIRYFIITKILHKKKFRLVIATKNSLLPYDYGKYILINKEIMVTNLHPNYIKIYSKHNERYRVYINIFTFKTINGLVKDIKHKDPFYGHLVTLFKIHEVDNSTLKIKSSYIFVKNIVNKGIII